MNLNVLDVNLGGGSLLQVANRGRGQMNSYLIETPEGKTVVIDGGYRHREDGEHLQELILERGGKVDLWMFSHAHFDHFGALLWLMEHTDKLPFTIERMCFSFPPMEWFKIAESGHEYDVLAALYRELDRHGITYEPLRPGMLECGGLTIEVLNDCDNYEKYNQINDTSILLRVHFPTQDVLFLGDLGILQGDDLLATVDHAKLRCDIVQMAHHGQNGASRAFYEVVSPKVCLYNAPDWLWENDNGGGKGSGPWKTLEVRQWMAEIGAVVSCPIAYGDYLLK